MSGAAAPAHDAHYRRMTQTPLPKLISTLAVPTILSMLVTALYNSADTYFVAQLGTSAAAAVGVVFSVMAVIQAVGFMLGMGAGSLVSRQLGARSQEEADCTGSTAFFTAVTFGLCIALGGLIFLDPLMRLLGATPTILPYAREYARCILLAAPVMCGSFVLNNILRSEGHAAFATIGVGTGSILNIALDPIFIFGFRLGIRGAALATALSQLTGLIILLSFFLRGKSQVRLRVHAVSRRFRVYRNIVHTGMPSFARQFLMSIAVMLMNQAGAVYGDAAIAAMSIVGRVFFLVFSFMLGFGQGFQPVAGYNFGAGNFGRVRGATHFAMLVGTVLMTVLGVLGFAFAPQAMALFRRGDAEVIRIGAAAFRAQCLVLPLFGISTVTNMLLQVTGRSGPATFLSMCRNGIFYYPIILIAPRIFGLAGVQYAQPAADVLSFLATLPFLFSFMKKLRRWEAESASPEKKSAL